MQGGGGENMITFRHRSGVAKPNLRIRRDGARLRRHNSERNLANPPHSPKPGAAAWGRVIQGGGGENVITLLRKTSQRETCADA